jgi:predicted DNA-binding transcriptional regulator YafY
LYFVINRGVKGEGIMSDKFASMLYILNRIDAGEPVTVQSLMDGLEISQRTVYRYMNDLQVGGFPIFFDKERGTYRFQDGYQIKKRTRLYGTLPT